MRLIGLCVAVFLISCGSSTVIPSPVIGVLEIGAPDSCEVCVDGVSFGFGTVTVPVVVNYPNYVQVGKWKFLLWPDVDYSGLTVCP